MVTGYDLAREYYDDTPVVPAPPPPLDSSASDDELLHQIYIVSVFVFYCLAAVLLMVYMVFIGCRLTRYPNGLGGSPSYCQQQWRDIPPEVFHMVVRCEQALIAAAYDFVVRPVSLAIGHVIVAFFHGVAWIVMAPFNIIVQIMDVIQCLLLEVNAPPPTPPSPPETVPSAITWITIDTMGRIIHEPAANRIAVTSSAGSIVLSTPQPIPAGAPVASNVTNASLSLTPDLQPPSPVGGGLTAVFRTVSFLPTEPEPALVNGQTLFGTPSHASAIYGTASHTFEGLKITGGVPTDTGPSPCRSWLGSQWRQTECYLPYTLTTFVDHIATWMGRSVRAPIVLEQISNDMIFALAKGYHAEHLCGRELAPLPADGVIFSVVISDMQYLVPLDKTQFSLMLSYVGHRRPDRKTCKPLMTTYKQLHQPNEIIELQDTIAAVLGDMTRKLQQSME